MALTDETIATAEECIAILRKLGETSGLIGVDFLAELIEGVKAADRFRFKNRLTVEPYCGRWCLAEPNFPEDIIRPFDSQWEAIRAARARLEGGSDDKSGG